MINRILIRMKVVQMLYSYLLTRNDFKLAQKPERNTRDNNFGYETYINLILLLLELSGHKIGSNNCLPNIKKNRLDLKITKALAADSEIRQIIARNETSIAAYNGIVPQLYDLIVNSTVFTDFSKKRNKTVTDEVSMWKAVVETIIAKNNDVELAARADESFTQAGFKMGVNMLLNTLNEFSENRDSLYKAQEALEKALDKAYELYHLLLLLPVEITRIQRDRIENAKEKYVPTSEDLNPNTRFIDNQLVKVIAESEQMAEYLKQNPINIESQYLLVKKLLDDVLQSEYYQNYMAMPSTDYALDCDFWRQVMKNVIIPSDALAEILESSSIYWNDDLDIMGTFAIKTIKQAAQGSFNLLPQYKDEDDAQFGALLFTDTINNRETYRSYIDRFIDQSQWDSDRLAFMDIIIMMVAISELLNFPLIPIPATLNEYIEIANSYSTPRSGQFINGMLFSIINYLKEEGLLIKN